jgi:hypothetical protein
MVLLLVVCRAPAALPRPERVGKLSNGKNAFATQLPALFRGQGFQQTEVVFLNR